MADSGSKDKPNLKICIDNTEKDSDDETSIALTDSSESEDDEKYSEKDTEDECVEFNVRIGKIRKPTSAAASATTTTTASTTTTTATKTAADKPQTKFEVPSRKYENRAGEFITGLDMTKQQLKEKKEERAKRFGIKVKSSDSSLNSEELYKSLGVKDDKYDERGLRPEAIHIRGLDNMNTQDVFKYFLEFGPGSIEWIDDTSCNVVWMDRVTAARAMLKLSRSQTAIHKYLSRQKREKRKKSVEKEESMETEDSEKNSGKLKTKRDSKAETAEEEDDDDELDLTEGFGDSGSKSKEEEETTLTGSQSMDTSENNTAPKESTDNAQETESQKKETTDMEEGEISDNSEDDKSEPDSSDEALFEPYKEVNLSRVIFPPGQWRLGQPFQKAKYIYFRFATKADQKLPGAERRSKYYVKHGNPNYGGMRGLISQSKKRRQHWQHRMKDVDEEDENATFVVKVPPGRVLPDYSDVAMFTDNVLAEDKDDFDRKPIPQQHSAHGSEGEEEWEDEEIIEEEEEERILSEDDDLYKTNEELEGAASGEEEDTHAMELELQKLLAAPKRSRRMHADDLEEEIKAKAAKRSDDPDDLQVIADVRERITSRKKSGDTAISSVLDARQLITGKAPDLRRRLENRRKKQVPSDRSKYHSLRIKVVD